MEAKKSIKLSSKYLQKDKYTYTWRRDQGDGEYAGKLDGIKVDKDEGYEVLYFIQKLMNKHNLKGVADVNKIEDALHHPSLSAIVMRIELEAKIEEMLSLN